MAKQQEKIDGLTQAQMDMIPDYVERYNKKSLAFGETDKAKAEAAVIALYNHMSKTESRYKPNPQIVWEGGVFAGAKKAAQLAKGDDNVTPEEIAAQADTASFGTFEAYWLSTYKFISDQLESKKDDLIEIVDVIVSECGVFWTFEDLVVMTPRPTMVNVVDGKIHNEEGPAIEFPNGEKIYALRGEFKNSLMDVLLQMKVDSTEKMEKTEEEA